VTREGKREKTGGERRGGVGERGRREGTGGGGVMEARGGKGGETERKGTGNLAPRSFLKVGAYAYKQNTRIRACSKQLWRHCCRNSHRTLSSRSP